MTIPFFQLIRQNAPSGLVVFLVALPLCLGVALASGAPPLSGILSGIIGGIVVGGLSRSHISVSGPAAGLTAIVFMAITELGSFELFLCAGLIAGGVQLLLGLLKAGSITNYFPSAVIEGMLAGIGVIIIVKEMPYALGDALFFEHIREGIISLHLGSLLIALLSAIILFSWEKLAWTKRVKWIPAALVAVVLGVLLNQLFIMLESPLALLPSQLVNLPVAHSLEEAEGLIRLPDFNGFTRPQTWLIGLSIAVVASIETLLSIEAADRLDAHRRITDTNHELRAQGVGNLFASLIGALPMTSVIVRSSANANAGATHKLSTIIHGFLLLVCVLAIPEWLNQIPLATLAVVLIFIGYKLTRPVLYRHFWRKGIYQFLPFLATMLAVVCLDLLKGVGIGLLISLGFILHRNLKRAYYLSREDLADAQEICLELAEEVTFLNKAAIKKTLKNVQPNSKITIDARKCAYIDHDVLELIANFSHIYAKENGIEVTLKGLRYDYEKAQSHSHIQVVLHKSP